MKNLVEKIAQETHLPVWLTALLVVVFVLRIPSFFEPYWYGDEAIYLALGESIRQGFLLYRDIYDNKPPFIYLVALVAGNLFWFKVILAFWNLATIYLFYKLGVLLWSKNEKLVRLSTIIFAILTTIPFLEGNIANAELFMLLPTITSFVILLSGKLTLIRVFIAGLVFGLGALFKVPSLVDAGVPVIYFVAAWLLKKLSWQKLATNSLVFVFAALLPIAATLLLFAARGVVGDYINAAFVQTVGYLSTWRAATGDFLTRNGPLILRGVLALVLVTTLLALYQKRGISQPFLFTGTWFTLSLFAALLSERPYPHYLIQVVPSFAFLLAVTVSSRTKEQFYSYPAFALLGAALFFYKFTYYGVFPYYENFLAWSVGGSNQAGYFARFDPRTPRNYEIARFIKERAMSEDRLFVWGDNPELYALTKLIPATRYVASYHIRDLQAYGEVEKSLSSNPPRFIVTTSSPGDFPQLVNLLSQDYLFIEQIKDARIWLNIARNAK